MPAAMRMGPVGLGVRELETVAGFYRDVVGLRVRERTDERAVLGTATADLLHLIGDPDQPARPPEAAGLYHVAFRVPTRAALGGALGRTADHLTGASDHGVSEALYLSDPEGNGVEIYRDRPEAEWPSEDGSLVIPTDPLDLESLQAVAEPGDRVPTGTDIGHVHLEVTDLDRAAAFFTDRLGLNRRYAYRGAAFLAAGGYHHHIGLNTWQRRIQPHSGAGIDWLSLVVPETAREPLLDALGEDGADELTVETADRIPIRLAFAD